MEQKTRHLLFTLLTALLFLFGVGLYATSLLHPYVPAYLSANIPFLALALGLILSHSVLLKEPLIDLVTETKAWSRPLALSSGLSYLAVLALFSALGAIRHPHDYHVFHTPLWKRIGFIAMALVITPIQTTGEEIVFRIIPLKLMKKIQSKTIRALATTLIITLVHLANREVAYSRTHLAVLLSYALFGFIPSYIAVRSDRYEFPLAIHAANNLFVVLICNYEHSSLPSLPLFFSTRPVGTWMDFIQLAVALGVAALIVSTSRRND
ncbi:MAG: CPBP family intramembrane metalloprotease [Spirochaetales bacterium]|nr:CPBP family intramembrane metalloprotease [Spirochaetales bacterium]